jgi:sec-independent protein translocase protein TatA
MFGGLGMGEMILIFLVVLLLFGAKRLPEIGSSLGKGIREFKSSVRDVEAEMKQPRYTPPPLPEPRSQLPGAAAASQAPVQTQAEPAPASAPAPDKPTQG